MCDPFAVQRLLTSPFVAKERQRGFGETTGRLAASGMFAEYGAMPAVGDDPKVCARNRGVHFHCQIDGIKRIPIAMHNQGAGCNSRQVRRREVHVIIAVPECLRLLPYRTDLLIAPFMPLPHLLPFLVGSSLRSHLAHDGARLLWKVRRRTHQNHGLDSIRLPGRHMKKRFSAHAHANCFESIDTQMFQQGKYVESRLAERELHRGIGCPSMATQIRYNQPVSVWGRFEDQVPIRAYSAAAVQKDQRLAFSANLVVHLNIVDRLSMPESRWYFHLGSC